MLASVDGESGRLESLAIGNIKEGVVPDVCGMGLVDAIYAIENSGFKARVKGHGKVINQALEAGKPAQRGVDIFLELN